MSFQHARLTLVARQDAGDPVVSSLASMRRDTHEAAASAARCLVSILEAHTAAGLPAGAAQDALDLAGEMYAEAARNRARIAQLTEMLRATARTYHVAYATPPECPPNTMAADPAGPSLPDGPAI